MNNYPEQLERLTMQVIFGADALPLIQADEHLLLLIDKNKQSEKICICY